MTEIIKVEEKDGIETVNARELHEFLGSKRKFSDWFKQRVASYGFEKNIDFTVHKFVIGKSTQIDYHISLDMAKELSMVENNDKGREARQYFIAREKQAKVLEKQIPQMSEAELIATALIASSRLLETSKKENTQLKAKLIQATPKIQFYDRVIASGGAISMEEVAKLIGVMGRNKLFAYLRNSGVLTNRNIPYQRYVDAMWFKLVESSYTTEDETVVTTTTRVYQRGVDGIIKMLKRDGYFEGENK